ncbi:MAG: 50S ribosomal protein L4 [Bdellovibrionales bacterium]|nr:50S ribosomal protein L4 [Bdellovibrionales bacterium]
MAMISVLDWDKKKLGEVDLPAAIFEQPVRKDLLKDVVVWQLASRRQGTHSVKTRAFVRGGGKKPFKQKGTGNARQGTSRSPLMPGGAKLFGPIPKDYSYTLPKKVKRAALRSALSYLVAEKKLFVVDAMTSKAGKTKDLSAQLKKFGVTKAVLIDSTAGDTMARASRNMRNFRYYGVEGLNVFDLLKYNTAVITKDSIQKIVSRCGVES